MIPFLKPDIIYDTCDVTAITKEDLEKLKINAIIFDLDNTIMAPKSGILEPKIESWLSGIRSKYKSVVLTNNKRMAYLENAEKVLKIPVIGYAKKPWTAGVLEALKILNEPNDKIVVIGDRPLTDIWLAQRHGFKSILHRALTADTEPRWKFFLRKLEWTFVQRK